MVAVLCAGGTVQAQSRPNYWFAGAPLVFAHLQSQGDDAAVATGDDGLNRLLAKAGATLSYAPGQRYVILATADHRTIVFTVGDAHYTVAGVVQTAPFAPYLDGSVAYLPLDAVLQSLGFAAVQTAAETIVQPQVERLDVTTSGGVTLVTVHGATALRFKRVLAAESLAIALIGASSALEPRRNVDAPGLQAIGVRTIGSPRNPTTTITFGTPGGGQVALAPSASANELVFAFAPPGRALGGTPVPPAGDAAVAVSALAGPGPARTARDGAAPRSVAVAAPGNADPSATLAPVAGTAMLTGVRSTPSGLGLKLDLTLTGGAVDYEWHRLPDNRWYVDLKNVTLAAPPHDEAVSSSAVSALRVKQLALDGAPVTRIALSLTSPRAVAIAPASGGVSIVVDALDEIDPVRSGTGTIAGGNVIATDAAPPGAVPPALAGPSAGDATPWKFAPPPPPSGNGRLIVIDPGHGGSDAGAQHNGLTEKDLTLDIAKRLRGLLVARGWQVKLTRDTDVDVFGVDASAHDELQARCDVANSLGARLFVSVHINSFTTSELNGTTTYYYNGFSLPLAQSVQRRLADSLGTKDDGVRRENFYVVHHTTMPSILVETAFLSNASDAAFLKQPAWRDKVAAGIASGIGDYDAALPAKAAHSGDAPGGGGS